VTLMDLQMPEMNGIDAIIAIRNSFPRHESCVDYLYGRCAGVAGSQAGAQGYLLKSLLHKNC